MTTDQLIAHVTENWTMYAGIAVVLAPILYFTRRVSVPIILWTFEITIYFVGFHIVLHGLVLFTGWFSVNTQMTTRVADRVDTGWTTPLLAPWDTAAYSPGWIVYLELAAIIFFTVLVYKMRPMKTQKVIHKAPPRSQAGQSGVRTSGGSRGTGVGNRGGKDGTGYGGR